MNLRIDNDEANLRVAPNTSLAPIARLPVGHLIVATGPLQGNWQPCRTDVDGHTLNGFVHQSLLRQPINPEVDRLVTIVGQEFKEFRFGARHETHPDSKPRIAAYWQSFGHPVEPVSTAWSAAFISFVMKTSLLTGSFKFAPAHTTYFSDSKTAFLNNDSSRAYWAVRLNERPLRVGDLVGYFRNGGPCGSVTHDYDDLPGSFCSHSDVVVSIRNNEALTIGGNTGNTVKVTRVPLTPAGNVATGNRRILVMSRTF